MNRFEKIDPKLIVLSERLGAKLNRNRAGSPEKLRTFKERRIYWVEDGINKAIIIQPTFTANGVDSSLWNVLNIAWYWYDETYPYKKFQWRKYLVEKDDFSKIESAIDELLSESETNLRNISKEDLK